MSSLETDASYRFLLNYVDETERVLQNALSKLDSKANCRIYPSADLGFPYDVIRLAGGFPTGIFVDWNCSVPFIPVDATVNVCTSSVYVLDDDLSDRIDAKLVNTALSEFDRSFYKQNFGSGNHFIIFARGETSGTFYLFLHSSASEFTKSYNGLYPLKDNWYSSYIQTYTQGKRHIRFLAGSKAELFFKIAKSAEPFNITRHDFIAELLTGDLCKILRSHHSHHYNMPTSSSILIGSYLTLQDEVVPIFSCPGHPFILFNATEAKHRIDIDGKLKLLIPHGWGKVIARINDIEVDWPNDCLLFNGYRYRISERGSLYSHSDLCFRNYSFNPIDRNWYFNAVKEFMTGNIKEHVIQHASYTNAGFTNWQK